MEYGPDIGPCDERTCHRMPSGYGYRWHGRGRTQLEHRWTMEEFLGRILSPEEVVMHRCDNPPCKAIHHLKVGTLADNNRDMADKGRARSRTTGMTHCGKCGRPYGKYVSPKTGEERNRCWPCYEAYQLADLEKRRVKNAALGKIPRRSKYSQES